MTEFQYEITKDDYVKCMKLAAAASKKQWLWLAIGGFVLLLLGLFGPRGLNDVGYFGLIGGAIGYLFTLHIFTPWQAKMDYRKYKSIQHPMAISLADGGYNIKAENGQSNVKWENLLKWREDNNFILVYLAPRLFHVIPKSIVDSGFDLEGFRKLLQDNLGIPK